MTVARNSRLCTVTLWMAAALALLGGSGPAAANEADDRLGALVARMTTAYDAGEAEKVRALCEEATKLAPQATDLWVKGLVPIWRARLRLSASYQQDLQAALELLQGASKQYASRNKWNDVGLCWAATGFAQFTGWELEQDRARKLEYAQQALEALQKALSPGLKLSDYAPAWARSTRERQAALQTYPLQAQAETAAAEGRWQEVIAPATEWLRLDRQATGAYVLRARAQVQLQQPQAALADLNEALRLAPDDRSVLQMRAAVYAAQGNSEQALADLNRLLELDPNNALAGVARARLYSAAGNPEPALADLTRALEADPANAEGRLLRSRLYLAAGNRGAALADLEKLPAAALDAELLRERARCYLEAAEQQTPAEQQTALYKAAAGDLTRALELAPGGPTLLGARAVCYLNLGEADKAAADAAAAVKAYGDSQSGEVGLPHYVLARVALGQGDLVAAKREAEETARYGGGGALGKSAAEVIEAVSQAVAERAKPIAAHLQEARRAAWQDDEQRAKELSAAALTDLEPLFAVLPKDPDLLYLRSRALYDLKRLVEARLAVDEAILLRPEQPEYLVARAEMRLDEDDPEDALRDCLKAAGLDPANDYNILLQGRVQSKLGEFRAAVEAFEKAAELKGTWAEQATTEKERMLARIPRAIGDLAAKVGLEPREAFTLGCRFSLKPEMVGGRNPDKPVLVIFFYGADWGLDSEYPQVTVRMGKDDNGRWVRTLQKQVGKTGYLLERSEITPGAPLQVEYRRAGRMRTVALPEGLRTPESGGEGLWLAINYTARR